MDPNGMGKMTDEKEEILFGDKEGEIVDFGSGKTKKDGKKKHINKIVYYDSDASSSSQKEYDDIDSKKKTIK
jgi:hypothetical protein